MNSKNFIEKKTKKCFFIVIDEYCQICKVYLLEFLYRHMFYYEIMSKRTSHRLITN